MFIFDINSQKPKFELKNALCLRVEQKFRNQANFSKLIQDYLWKSKWRIGAWNEGDDRNAGNQAGNAGNHGGNKGNRGRNVENQGGKAGMSVKARIRNRRMERGEWLECGESWLECGESGWECEKWWWECRECGESVVVVGVIFIYSWIGHT